VHFHNPATDVPRLGIPGYVISEFEFVCHDSSPGILHLADKK
jgi:hypothetical protein